MTTGSVAGQLCTLVFGRDEDDAELVFTQAHIDAMLSTWKELMRPITWGQLVDAPGPDRMLALELTVSDKHKALLLASKQGFVPYLLDGLLLDPDHPRAGLLPEKKASLQQMHAECLAQLALFGPAKEALCSAGVSAALERVAEGGLNDEAKKYARQALFELRPTRAGGAPVAAAAVSAEHVMLSYNWGHQPTIKRIKASLASRGYTVWIDIEKMQGSTVEMMAAAVEDAAVLVYGISRAYKESVNCRLEAQYAFQRQKEMVPLMLEEGYRPDGWLGMLLGTRLWYLFCGSVLVSEGAFESKMEELCRELRAWSVPQSDTPSSILSHSPRHRASGLVGALDGAAVTPLAARPRFTDSTADFTPSMNLGSSDAPTAARQSLLGGGAMVAAAAGLSSPAVALSEGYYLRALELQHAEREREKAMERERGERSETRLTMVLVASASAAVAVVAISAMVITRRP